MIEVVDLTSELVAIPNENPGGNERAVAALVADKCAALGLPEPRLVCAEDRPNLVVDASSARASTTSDCAATSTRNRSARTPGRPTRSPLPWSATS